MKKGITLLFACFLMSAQANALTILKQVQVSPNEQVDLLFDQKLSKNQIKIDYLRDIVQFSLKNVSVYPAKIMSVSSPDLKKVFAYQYTPNLVRFRMTVGSEAQNYKGRVSYKVRGKLLTIHIEKPKTAAAVTQPKKVEKKIEDKVVMKAAKNQKKPEEKKLTKEENKLLGEVIGKTEKKSTSQGSHLPSFTKIFGWMLTLLGAFVFLVFTLKKLKKKDSSGFISKIFKKIPNTGFLGKTKLIDVVSNHYLGPKKSIAVVKVQGRMLLVGITNESINLISELDENSADFTQGTGAVAAGDAIFSQVLNQKMEPKVPAQKQVSRQSVRDEIKRKVGSLKAF